MMCNIRIVTCSGMSLFVPSKYQQLPPHPIHPPSPLLYLATLHSGIIALKRHLSRTKRHLCLSVLYNYDLHFLENRLKAWLRGMFESSAGRWMGGGLVGCRPGVCAHWFWRSNSAAPQLIVSKSPARRGSRHYCYKLFLVLVLFFYRTLIYLAHERTDRVSVFLLCRKKENIIVLGLNEKDQTGFIRQQSKLKVSSNNECWQHYCHYRRGITYKQQWFDCCE